MRYVRFLKTPRVVADKKTGKSEVYCLITITSDLGDSFLPCDVELSAELLSSKAPEQALIWRTVHWTSGTRSLPVTFPLPKALASSSLRLRVGVEPKARHDEYEKLSEEGRRGVVSAWSAEFRVSVEAVKLVERRFIIAPDRQLSIWEETGESIARHLWDAGITLSCHLKELLDPKQKADKALFPLSQKTNLQVLELGTGCGIVGISLWQIHQGAKVCLTDLPEAQEIIERNIRETKTSKCCTLQFQELDWEAELPENLQFPAGSLDLILAADCTYNADSSPALVNTILRFATVSPQVIVAIAMKMRHSSEEVFFDLMAAAGFHETQKLAYPLPGDVDLGEETVYVHVYKYSISSR